MPKLTKLHDREDVTLAKTIVKVAMWCRIAGNAKMYMYLMRTALLLHGRTNFIFTFKAILPKHVTHTEYTSMRLKVVRPLIKNGIVQSLNMGRNFLQLTLTEKGKQEADKARDWFYKRNLSISQWDKTCNFVKKT